MRGVGAGCRDGGRSPQSGARFMELRARGWGLKTIAKEIGISRSTAKRWHRGDRRTKAGEFVGFTPPLERLAVRQISARFLSQEERIVIGDLRRDGLSVRGIAAVLGRAPSTISRELRRDSRPASGYRPFDAHRQALQRRVRHHRRRIDRDDSCDEWSLSCWSCGGVRLRSLATCGHDSPTIRNVGSATKRSTRPFTSRDPR
jgi:transposase, IS30 family